jgi:hypothetical protein
MLINEGLKLVHVYHHTHPLTAQLLISGPLFYYSSVRVLCHCWWYTEANAESSRSHSITTISIVQERAGSDHGSMNGRLRLVDLAGSEQAESTGTDSDRLAEAKEINTSLLSLGNVVNALAKQQVCIILHYFPPSLLIIIGDD